MGSLQTVLPAVARRNGVSPSLLFSWRREARTVVKNDITPRFAPVRIAASDVDLEIAKGSSEACDRARTSAMPTVRGSMIEIDLGSGRRIDAFEWMRKLTPMRSRGSLTCWSADDCDPQQCACLACDRTHRHAARISEPRAARPGEFEA